jgi:hypothetical protein
VQAKALTSPIGVICLLQIQSDQAILVASPARVIHAVGQRQAQTDQRIEQAMLCQFVKASVGEIFGNGKIRDDPIVTACQTEISIAIGWRYPVTGIEL